jgi:hypothetical protein
VPCSPRRAPSVAAHPFHAGQRRRAARGKTCMLVARVGAGGAGHAVGAGPGLPRRPAVGPPLACRRAGPRTRDRVAAVLPARAAHGWGAAGGRAAGQRVGAAQVRAQPGAAARPARHPPRHPARHEGPARPHTGRLSLSGPPPSFPPFCHPRFVLSGEPSGGNGRKARAPGPETPPVATWDRIEALATARAAEGPAQRALPPQPGAGALNRAPAGALCRGCGCGLPTASSSRWQHAWRCCRVRGRRAAGSATCRRSCCPASATALRTSSRPTRTLPRRSPCGAPARTSMRAPRAAQRSGQPAARCRRARRQALAPPCPHGSRPAAAPPRRAAPARCPATRAALAARRLKLHKGWWSAKEPAAQVTIVTGLNPSRLKQLGSQCRSWRGPISAAVYVVLLHPNKDQPLPAAQQKRLDDAAAQVEAFHKRCARGPAGRGHAAGGRPGGRAPTARASAWARARPRPRPPHGAMRRTAMQLPLTPPPAAAPMRHAPPQHGGDAGHVPAGRAAAVRGGARPRHGGHAANQHHAQLRTAAGGAAAPPRRRASAPGRRCAACTAAAAAAAATRGRRRRRHANLLQRRVHAAPLPPLLQARTELVSMVDVDLLVSNSLFEWVQSADK